MINFFFYIFHLIIIRLDANWLNNLSATERFFCDKYIAIENVHVKSVLIYFAQDFINEDERDYFSRYTPATNTFAVIVFSLCALLFTIGLFFMAIALLAFTPDYAEATSHLTYMAATGTLLIVLSLSTLNFYADIVSTFVLITKATACTTTFTEAVEAFEAEGNFEKVEQILATQNAESIK